MRATEAQFESFLKRFDADWFIDRSGAPLDWSFDWSLGWRQPDLIFAPRVPTVESTDSITAVAIGGGDDSTPVSSPAFVPGDSGFSLQWHLQNTAPGGVDLNVVPVWDDYTGNGVVVGVVDDGIHYNHLDLSPNYRNDIDWDARGNDNDSIAESGDSHGTAVSGVIAAEEDNSGLVGVAFDADLTMFRMGFGAAGSPAQELVQMQNMATVDVANNSWGYSGYFYDDFGTATFSTNGQAIEDAAANGRGGLGTVTVFSAGNEGDEGQNTNYHNYQNNPYVITVGAVDSDGDYASFSTPGANVLVSAPGVGIYTTYFDPNFYAVADGTSFSAPAVAGVAALMLEANPNLGYRDVQEILAYSSWDSSSSATGWQTNGAVNWNGGGLTVHDGYGFGLVDAHAAVRLVETWTAQSTTTNLQTLSMTSTPGIAFSETQAAVDTVTFSSGLDIDHVQIDLDLNHTWIGDLTVNLVSPDGTNSLLIDRPGVGDPNYGSAGVPNAGVNVGVLSFTLGSVQFWGEDGIGTWTLTVADAATGDSGVLNSWTVNLLGDTPSADDTYFFTKEWADLGSDAARQTLQDGGGTDTLNFATLTSDLTFDLTPGTVQGLLGQNLTLDAASLFENAIGGAGDDQFTGNDAENLLVGMHGDDTLIGGAGDDTLIGGDDSAGGSVPLLSGGDPSEGDTAVFSGTRADYSVILSSSASSGPNLADTVLDTGFDAVDGSRHRHRNVPKCGC